MTSQPASETTAPTGWPDAGRWSFEGGNSEIAFSVKHMMISRVRGSFRDFSGEIVIAETPAASRASVSIAAESIDTGMPAREKDLRGKDFLDVEAHPRITFISTGLDSVDGAEFDLLGDLTIAGRTQPVRLTVEFAGATTDPWGHTKAVFSARTKLQRADWGLTYNAALEGGGVLIGPSVDVEIEIQAKPASEGSDWG